MNEPLQVRFSDEINVISGYKGQLGTFESHTMQCVKVNLPAVGRYHVSLKLELFGSDKYRHHHCHDNSNIAVTVLQPHYSNVVS